MQQFALASVYPRSIAWLIRFNEWDRFEKIISYNCAMIGGDMQTRSYRWCCLCHITAWLE